MLKEIPGPSQAFMGLLPIERAVLRVLMLHAALKITERLYQTWQIFYARVKLFLSIFSECVRIMIESVSYV